MLPARRVGCLQGGCMVAERMGGAAGRVDGRA